MRSRQIGFGGGESGPADHFGGDEGALERLHRHQMAAVVGQVACALGFEGFRQLDVAGDGFGQVRRDGRRVGQAGQDLVGGAVQQDGGARAGLRHRSVAVGWFAGLQNAA